MILLCIIGLIITQLSIIQGVPEKMSLSEIGALLIKGHFFWDTWYNGSLNRTEIFRFPPWWYVCRQLTCPLSAWVTINFMFTALLEIRTSNKRANCKNFFYNKLWFFCSDYIKISKFSGNHAHASFHYFMTTVFFS